jgi:hypothetical protein
VRCCGFEIFKCPEVVTVFHIYRDLSGIYHFLIDFGGGMGSGK